MSDLVSHQLLEKLREAANGQLRPGERNGTLDRLVEACDAIASGQAHVVVKEGLPHAEFNFKRKPTLIKPPRIEEYVLARRALDLGKKRIPSTWTGPMAVTIRKDPALLEYVRTREQEQVAGAGGRVAPSADRVIDRIEDLALRSELRLLLARGRHAEQDLLRLKSAMRRLRPTFDVERLVLGAENNASGVPATSSHTLPAPAGATDAKLRLAAIAIMRLSDQRFLAQFGLELSAEFGNVIERRTRAELISAEELAAFQTLTGVT